jgi:hypothetical protein
VNTDGATLLRTAKGFSFAAGLIETNASLLMFAHSFVKVKVIDTLPYSKVNASKAVE